VYASSRYPGDFGMVTTGKPTISESIELFEIAKKIFKIILRIIES